MLVISSATVDQVELLHTLGEHSDRVYGLGFSSDGRLLASGSWDGTIRLWDVDTWQAVRTFDQHGNWEVFFAPDDAHIASEDGAIWDIASGERVRVLDVNDSHVTFSPDGTWMASAGYNAPIELWDVDTWRVVRTLEGHSDRVFGVAFSPDSTLLASGSGMGPSDVSDFVVKLWDVVSGQEIYTLRGHGGDVHAVAFSPDGEFLASASIDGTVKLWDVQGGQLVHTLRHRDGLWDVAFSPDGTLLASAGVEYMVRLWDVESGQLLRTIRHDDEVMAVAFSPDGSLLASGGYDDKVYVWGIAASSATPVEKEIKVGLYAGAGAANACATAAGEMFQWMGYTVEWINADTVNDADLHRIDVLYFPGGSAGPYQEDISAEGREKIRQLVQSGGCFIGTCAGALFAAEQVIWEGAQDSQPTLGLFPGTVQGPIPEIYTNPEYGMCQVNLEPHPITGTEPDSVWILYYNGPFFSPNPGAEVDIVGRYEITNEPAIVAFEYGAGRVILTGPHPEWEEDDDRDDVSHFDRFDDRGSDWDLMLQATLWCLGEID
jgi:glutamine amidotransferase-like uncharacterized protein